MSTSPDDQSGVTTTFVIPTVYARRLIESLRDVGLIVAPMPNPPDDPRLGMVHVAIPDHEVVSLLAAMSERYTVTREDTFGSRVAVSDVHVVEPGLPDMVEPGPVWRPRLDLMQSPHAERDWPLIPDVDALAVAAGTEDSSGLPVCASCGHLQGTHIAGPYESPDGTQQRLVVICPFESGEDEPGCPCLTRLDPEQITLPTQRPPQA